MSFVPVQVSGPEPDLRAIITRMISLPRALDQIGALYAGLEPCFAPLVDAVMATLPDHDVLVHSYLFPFLKNAARAAKKPCAALVFCANSIPFPQTWPDDVPPPSRGLPGALARMRNRAAWRGGQMLLDRLVNRHAGTALKKHSLGSFDGFLHDPADVALVAVSRGLFPPPAPPPEPYVYTGFLRWQPVPTSKALQYIEQVHKLEDSGAPVPILTLGSMNPVGAQNIIQRLSDVWPQGMPLVVQAGWAGFEEIPTRSDVHVIGAAPHDALFAYAAVVVHHGGAGTTGSALYACRPQVVIPHLGDQSYWARELEKLGVARVLGLDRWPEELFGVFEHLLHDVPRIIRVAECAAIIRGEDGAGKTVEALEKLT